LGMQGKSWPGIVPSKPMLAPIAGDRTAAPWGSMGLTNDNGAAISGSPAYGGPPA